MTTIEVKMDNIKYFMQDKITRISDIHEDLNSKIDDLVRVQYEANR